MVPPLIPLAYVMFLPESPRYLLQMGIQSGEQKYIRQAYRSLVRLNKTPLQAAREIFSIYHGLIELQRDERAPWHTTVKEVFTENRTRHALLGSSTVMFLQQFCGVNVMAYYSTPILKDLTSNEINAFLVSAQFLLQMMPVFLS